MNEEIMLTVRELSNLKGCTERHIRQQILEKKIECIEIEGKIGGKSGKQYRIPLYCLSERLRLLYKRKNSSRSDPEVTCDEFDLESLTKEDRDRIAQWKTILTEWRRMRCERIDKSAADVQYILLCNVNYPNLKISRRTLYQKWKDWHEEGEAALADRRGKHGQHAKKLTKYILDIFELYYLEESQKSVSLCVSLTKIDLEKQVKEGLIAAMPDLPKEDAFCRHVDQIPIPYIKFYRFGLKEFIGQCEPYIRRTYENLEPNDIWVADNHTFDLMVYDGAKPIRLYLTAFMDVRTRKMMGWCVTDKPCSDATIYALRKGIERHGIPKGLYTDNGREFLFHDFGGNGFRKKKATLETCQPPTILKQLGIDFRTALPRNARAKGIERAFKTVKETFSKLFDAYTGGNVLEKPERLKVVVKNPDRMKKVEEFIEFAGTWLSGWYNKQPHSGEGMYGRSPDEAYAELLVEKRTATESQLNLMFMRWSNKMKVGKNGVTLTFYEKKLQYFDEDLWLRYFGKEVYIRYNPDNLREVRVYDTDERFICIARLREELPYDASKEAVANAQKERRSAVKKVSQYLADKGIKNHDALSLILDKATENMKDEKQIDIKLIHPIFHEEPMAKASGFGDVSKEKIDWSAALDRLEEQREGR